MLLTPQPSLVDQAYEAILGEITDGTLPPESHLVQEALAARYGVSRQPIQQALLLLRNDGILQDAGRRGLVVAPLDTEMMQSRYQVRAALDVLAARLAAKVCATSPSAAERIRHEGEQIIEAGQQAIAAGDIKAMVAQDIAFHAFVYAASGNALIGPTAQVLWRYLRRVMGEVLRRAGPPTQIWQQHQRILQAIVAGDAEAAAAHTSDHIDSAASRLAGTPSQPPIKQQKPRKRPDDSQRRRA